MCIVHIYMHKYAQLSIAYMSKYAHMCMYRHICTIHIYAFVHMCICTYVFSNGTNFVRFYLFRWNESRMKLPNKRRFVALREFAEDTKEICCSYLFFCVLDFMVYYTIFIFEAILNCFWVWFMFNLNYRSSHMYLNISF